MADKDPIANLPVGLENAFTGVVHALIPSSLKAVNRLIGAGVDIPAAYLERIASRTRAKTKSYVAVEEAVAAAVAQGVAADPAIAHRAMGNLLGKEYRKQENREAIAREFLNDLQKGQDEAAQPDGPVPELDDDWLNVFERYAEDASTERMQKLWGRVLAGETRKPGRYSMRTLRFLSEFSQHDALLFAEFCDGAFGGVAPLSLAKPEGADQRALIDLEAAGLVTGASGMGLECTIHFDGAGNGFLIEGPLGIQFRGPPGSSFVTRCCTLTPLAQELTSLLPGRDPRTVAKKVATAMKQASVSAAMLVAIDQNKMAHTLELLWSPPST